MASLFQDATNFNGDISGWDVGAVTSMRAMFLSAESFDGTNGDLSGWDVGSVATMDNMFATAIIFNGDLSGWDVGSVANMQYMFYHAPIFNRDLAGWDTSSVTFMAFMFGLATDFNGDVSAWDTSSVITMERMFEQATDFNGDLSAWDVGSVTQCSPWHHAGVTVKTIGCPTVPPFDDDYQDEPNEPQSTSNSGEENNGDNVAMIASAVTGAVILVMAIVLICQRVRAQRQPQPAVQQGIQYPAFTEPERAAVKYDEMGHVVPARRRLDEGDYIEGSNQSTGQPNALYVEPTPVGTHA